MESRAVIAHDLTARLTRKPEISRISTLVPPCILEKAAPRGFWRTL